MYVHFSGFHSKYSANNVICSNSVLNQK